MCFSFALLSFGASCATGSVFLYFFQYLADVWCCCCFFFILLVFCFILAGPFRVSVSRFNVCEYDLSTCIDIFTAAASYGRNVYKIASVYRSWTNWLTACLPAKLAAHSPCIYSPRHSIFRCDSTTQICCVYFFGILSYSRSTLKLCPSSGATCDKISN